MMAVLEDLGYARGKSAKDRGVSPGGGRRAQERALAVISNPNFKPQLRKPLR